MMHSSSYEFHKAGPCNQQNMALVPGILKQLCQTFRSQQIYGQQNIHIGALNHLTNRLFYLHNIKTVNFQKRILQQLACLQLRIGPRAYII